MKRNSFLKLLDCENAGTALESLPDILNLSKSEILSILTDFDFDEFYAANPNVHYPEKALLNYLSAQFRIHPVCDWACWFHLTRRPRGNLVIEDLLPLNDVADHIWDYLYRLAPSQLPADSWLKFRNLVETDYDHHHASLYRLRLSAPEHWGPYGYLAKDFSCFTTDFSDRHYLRCPEIVEDICLCAQREFGIDLQQKYVESTEPCIVKFKHESTDPSLVGHALHYLHSSLRGVQLHSDQNVPFVSDGKRIPKERIVWVRRALYNAPSS